MRFGLFFQGAWLATILRDQGLNVLLVTIAGTAALGAWALAQRLLIVLTLLFESAWRVALPGFARLTEAGEPGARLLERGLSFAATSSGAMVVVVVGATPAIVPALFGDDWSATVSTLPWLAAGMMVAVPLITVLGSLLWARGEAEKVFYMAAPAIAITLVLGAALAVPLGALGAAIGYFVGQVILMLACIYRARELFGRGAATQIAVPTLSAAAGGGIGWLLAVSVDPAWAGAISGAAGALGIYALLMVTLDRPAMRRLLSVLRQSVRPATT
jgi:O-antigen/teichoic acid export membrane protein